MVKTISPNLIFVWICRDWLLLFGRGVRNLYTSAKADIHPLGAMDYIYDQIPVGVAFIMSVMRFVSGRPKQAPPRLPHQPRPHSPVWPALLRPVKKNAGLGGRTEK